MTRSIAVIKDSYVEIPARALRIIFQALQDYEEDARLNYRKFSDDDYDWALDELVNALEEADVIVEAD